MMYELKSGEYRACFNCGICFMGQNLLLNCCVAHVIVQNQFG